MNAGVMGRGTYWLYCEDVYLEDVLGLFYAFRILKKALQSTLHFLPVLVMLFLASQCESN